MRKFVIAAGAAALLGASSLAALADEATGKITAVDVASSTVTLEDGKIYKLPQTVDAASLAVGDSVTIEFQTGADGMMTATSVEKSAM